MAEDRNWSWWVGRDCERYTIECATREEAVRIAQEEYDGAYIVEAVKPGNIRLSDYFRAERFIEDADERAYDDHADPDGGDAVFMIKPEDVAGLEASVRSAIDHWQERHGLVFTGFQFSASRNEEYVPVSNPAPEE
jgi:hypothetical protein